nr:Chain B5, ErmBL [Escherichia coli]5JU8_B5 Chain B5, ErmBL [Escherichia coli]
AVFQMRNVD